MEFKEVRLEDIPHEHPLTLVDLQLVYQNYEEDDDDFEDTDLIACQKFKCLCDMCGFGIDWYHRYYYKCSESCNYSLHKFCAEMSTWLRFPAHPTHTLILNKAASYDWTCHGCHTQHRSGMSYLCSACNYQIDLRCATFVEQNTIHHPGHPHPLVYVTMDPILYKCFACGMEHEGFFYHCTTCFNFSIHIDCVTLPIKFLLHFSHPHMLTLSYSLSVIPYGSKCRICGVDICYKLWLYKCSKCRYYVHLDCATSRGGTFTSIISKGTGKREKNYEDVHYPHLLHFPLPDESYHILPHQILREKNCRYVEQIRDENGYLKHPSHEHPLVLIHMTSTSTMSLHNPMKRIKLLCNGCVRPVTTMPFYKCDKGCDFYLHKWCSRLPTELHNHPRHPNTLLLSLKHNIYQEFTCGSCQLPCNGFGYACSKYSCNYRIDVHCAFIPEKITHEAHSNHLLSRLNLSSFLSPVECNACHAVINRREICFGCNACDFYLDSRCALHLPKTIRNKYDKHSLKLSYSPIENHKSQYFCEVCEEDLNPEKWFYHCLECNQSIHSACAPLILQSEQDVNSHHVESIYMFVNIKFGGVMNVEYHPHPLSFVAGDKSAGDCTFCGRELQSKLIFKCLQCKFACHNYACHGLTERDSAPLMDPPYFFRNSWKDMLRKTVRSPGRSTVNFYPSRIMRPVTNHQDNLQL